MSSMDDNIPDDVPTATGGVVDDRPSPERYDTAYLTERYLPQSMTENQRACIAGAIRNPNARWGLLDYNHAENRTGGATRHAMTSWVSGLHDQKTSASEGTSQALNRRGGQTVQATTFEQLTDKQRAVVDFYARWLWASKEGTTGQAIADAIREEYGIAVSANTANRTIRDYKHLALKRRDTALGPGDLQRKSYEFAKGTNAGYMPVRSVFEREGIAVPDENLDDLEPPSDEWLVKYGHDIDAYRQSNAATKQTMQATQPVDDDAEQTDDDSPGADGDAEQNGGEYECQYCGETFDQPIRIAQHVKAKHYEQTKPETEELTPFDCPVSECDRAFSTEQGLRIHFGQLHESEPTALLETALEDGADADTEQPDGPVGLDVLFPDAGGDDPVRADAADITEFFDVLETMTDRLDDLGERLDSIHSMRVQNTGSLREVEDQLTAVEKQLKVADARAVGAVPQSEVNALAERIADLEASTPGGADEHILVTQLRDLLDGRDIAGFELGAKDNRIKLDINLANGGEEGSE